MIHIADFLDTGFYIRLCYPMKLNISELRKKEIEALSKALGPLIVTRSLTITNFLWDIIQKSVNPG